MIVDINAFIEEFFNTNNSLKNYNFINLKYYLENINKKKRLSLLIFGNNKEKFLDYLITLSHNKFNKPVHIYDFEQFPNFDDFEYTISKQNCIILCGKIINKKFKNVIKIYAT